MSDDRALIEFTTERERVAHVTRLGIGMPMAGCLYWIGVGFLLSRFAPEPALVFSFALTGMVFPIGFLLTKLVGGDLFAKSASFGSLGIILAAIQLFYWPVLMVVYSQAYEWTPYVLVVLFGSHFLPYLWLYASRGYAILAIATCVVPTVAVIVRRDPLYHHVPWIAAACYAVALVVLWGEMRRRTAMRSPQAARASAST